MTNNFDPCIRIQTQGRIIFPTLGSNPDAQVKISGHHRFLVFSLLKNLMLPPYKRKPICLFLEQKKDKTGLSRIIIRVF